jgi:nicotinamide mononucleotide transporter
MMNAIFDLLNAPMVQAWGATMSAAEVLGFATGVFCVWLTLRKNIWNFPIGIANSVLLGLLFFHSRLFADTGLQVMFIVLALLGWYQWFQSKQNHSSHIVVVRTLNQQQKYLTVGAIAISVAVLYFVLTWLKGSIPLFDASITALSVVAQILLNKRYLENWWIWIVTDIISIPVYAYKGLWLVAILYIVFLVLASMGLIAWRKTYHAQG